MFRLFYYICSRNIYFMKEEILKLRSEGLSYRQIKNILGCSTSTISYHCGEGQKEKNRKRHQKWKNNNPLKVKTDRFLSRGLKMKIRDFQRNRDKGVFVNGREFNFNYSELLEKIENNPVCYLTGEEIDLKQTALYHFDHIKPVSKGGTNHLSNLGLTTKKANRAKGDLTLNEFLGLCEKVLVNNGYTVSKPKRS